MAQLDYPPVQQALEHIKHLSASSTRKRWMRFLLNSDTVFGAIVPHSLAPNSLP